MNKQRSSANDGDKKIIICKRRKSGKRKMRRMRIFER